MLEYRGFGCLARTLAREVHRLPRDVDLVVGVPRGGVPAAALAAAALNRPVADLDSWLAAATGDGDGARAVLVIDDCVDSGATMAATVARIRARRPELRLVTAAVYGESPAPAVVDVVLEPCPRPRVFEWSLFRGPLVARSCYDFDGVLCPDPAPADDDDGERYHRFLTTTPPLVIPVGRPRRIVTARLEKYRAITEDWLARHGVDFEELVMVDLPSAAERRRRGGVARLKAAVYAEDAAATLFIESSSEQAEAIARHSGKPVFDYAGRRLLGPGGPRPVEAARRDPALWARLRRGVRWRVRRGVARLRPGASPPATPAPARRSARRD
jgi:hypothetical protein